MKSYSRIPRSRLKNLPNDIRPTHEYCFFLHDQCVAMLKEYEIAQAHTINISMKPEESARFEELAKNTDTLFALESLGFSEQSKRVAINSITMGMVSDCLHHLYEGLRCFEKRKFIVGFNLLRKPLLDSLVYLTWIFCRENEFYQAFKSNDPELLTQKIIGNKRKEIFEETIKLTSLANLVSAEEINAILFARTNESGLQLYFQHAVHLITTQHTELRTSEQNFNFIFMNPWQADDVYENLYRDLPIILLYLSHVVLGLFDRMGQMSENAKSAFHIRASYGYLLLCAGLSFKEFKKEYKSLINVFSELTCENCKKTIKISRYNLAKILLTDSCRCQGCKRDLDFPFSYLF